MLLALTASCAIGPEVHTVVIAPPAPLDEELAFAPTDPAPEPEPGCHREVHLHVGRISLSNATVRRMFDDARKPLRDAMCDCAQTSTAIVAITPARGAIEVSGVDERTAECMRARLVAPLFVPWTFQSDCPTCGLPLGIFPASPGPTPAPDGTLFASVRFE